MYMIFYTGGYARKNYIHTPDQFVKIANKVFGLNTRRLSLKKLTSEMGAILYKVYSTNRGLKISRM